MELQTGDRVVTQRGVCGTVQERLVTVLDLLDGVFVIVRSDGDVTAIDNLQSGQERVNRQGNVVAAIQSKTA